MVDAGVRGSAAVQHLKRRPNRMLITILLGNNLVNIGASVMAAAWTTLVFGSAALGYATAVLTLLVLVFGEIFPKTFAQQHAERFACIMARPLLVLQTAVLPLIWLLERLLVASMRHMRVRARLQLDATVELKATMDMLSREGKLEDSLQHLMSGTFTFGKKRVSEVMTPRSRIVAVERNAPLAELRRLFLASGVTRVPVYQDRLDIVRGVVSMHMLLQAEQDGRALVADIAPLPAVVVAPTMYVDDLLVRLQAEKQHLAVVTDKAGRVAGVVTVENALEEIVGEIFDEEDRFRVFVHRRGDRRWEVTADCPIYEFRNYFRAFEPEQPPFKSIEALYLEKTAGVQPAVGARVEGDGYAMEVLDMKDNRIVRLLIEQAA
jgi:putative hemolysin